jgi:seryl-tRNA synthetase
MLDLHTGEHGYTEVNPPLMVNDAAAYGTDKLPKFGDDLFRTTDGRWLIPTAEVPLTYMAAGEIIAEEEAAQALRGADGMLPLRSRFSRP